MNLCMIFERIREEKKTLREICLGITNGISEGILGIISEAIPDENFRMKP